MAAITAIASSALGGNPTGVPFPGGSQMYGPLETVIYLTMSGESPAPGFGIMVYVKDVATGLIESARQSLSVGGNPAQIRLDAPQLTAGNKVFAVFDNGGMSAYFGTSFELLLAPTITTVAPDPANAGETVTVTGTGFRPETTGTVDGGSVTLSIASTTSLSFTMPTLSTGLGSKDLVLTNDGGEADGTVNYGGSLRVTSVDPDRISQGIATDVTITGVSFTEDCEVAVDVTDESSGEPCSNVVIVSSTSITCTIPALARGTHSIRVTSPSEGFDAVSFYVFQNALIRGAGIVIKMRAEMPSPPSGSNAIVVNATRASAQIPRLAPPPNRSPYLYDASATGLPVSRNHYFQGFDTAAMLLESLATGHEDDGTSVISLAGLKSGVRFTSSVEVTRSVTPVTTELMAHGGDAWSAFQRLQSPEQQDEDGNVLSFPDGDTAFVSIGLAFDDTKVYAVHLYRLGLPNGIDDFIATLDTTLFKPEAATLPTIGARNYTNPAVEGYSWGPAAYQRELDDATKLVAMYEAEHDIPTGNHRIPLERFNGFSVAFDATVSAPASVGDRALFEIESAGTDRLYVAPALVPESGSGILQVSLAFSKTKTYASIRRLTAGSTNATRLVVWRVSPS